MIMKKIILSALILTSIISCSNNEKPANSKTDTKQINQETHVNNDISLEHSVIYWKGTKAIGGGHMGTVRFQDGVFNFKDNQFENGTFTIDMNTIECTDVKDKDSNADLVGHLKSGDFFDAENFPTAKVELYKMEMINEGTYKCVASIQIKEVVRKMELELITQSKNDKHVLLGRLSIDRTQFGVVYNSSNFFKSLGDKVIDDEIQLKFEIIQK